MLTHLQNYFLLFYCKLQYSYTGPKRDEVHITAMFIQFGVIENESVCSLLSVSNTP
jgi:hypothetical protein